MSIEAFQFAFGLVILFGIGWALSCVSLWFVYLPFPWAGVNMSANDVEARQDRWLVIGGASFGVGLCLGNILLTSPPV